MKPANYAKAVFERECGPGVLLIGVAERERGTDFTFQIIASGKRCTIGTIPKGRGRAAFEEVAAQAGKWARVMSEQFAATVH